MPHSSRTTPRRKIAAPMVTMMVLTTDAPAAGSMAKRSSSRPTSAVNRVAPSPASTSGKPAFSRATVAMAPSITNSPWAKFTTSEAL